MTKIQNEMDVLSVTVYNEGTQTWEDPCSVEIPQNLDDGLAITLAFGLVWEETALPLDSKMIVSRESNFDTRILYERT